MSKEKERVIDFWRKSADRDIGTAKGLFRLKRYDACLFFCHLALEKSLKGLVVKVTDKPAPYSHDLEQLARLVDTELSKERAENLKMITDFNIAGRYDNEKLDFYKKATKVYTQKYLKITEELFVWLKKRYQKK